MHDRVGGEEEVENIKSPLILLDKIWVALRAFRALT